MYILNINLMMPLKCLKPFTSSWLYFVCLTNLFSPIFKRLTLSTYYFRFAWLVPLLPYDLCSNFTLSKMSLPNWSHSTSFHLLYFIHSSMQPDIYLFILFICVSPWVYQTISFIKTGILSILSTVNFIAHRVLWIYYDK